MIKIVLFLIAVALNGCSLTGDCENQVLQQLTYSDESPVAVYHSRSCGATTGVAYVVTLVDSFEDFDPEADRGRVAVYEGAENLRLYWEEPNLLVIKNRPADPNDVYKELSRWKNVMIRYE